MKKVLSLFVLFLSAGVFAASAKPENPAPLHPVTSSATVMPRTDVPVLRPVTNTPVNRPTTSGSVLRPVTPGTAVSGVPKANVSLNGVSRSNSSTGSYTPSYKNAKNLASSQAPAAAKTTQGEKGLGFGDNQAAAKAALAAQEQKKAESAEVGSKDVLKSTVLPPEVKKALETMQSGNFGGKKK